MKVGDLIEVRWAGQWRKVILLKVGNTRGGESHIHTLWYDGTTIWINTDYMEVRLCK